MSDIAKPLQPLRVFCRPQPRVSRRSYLKKFHRRNAIKAVVITVAIYAGMLFVGLNISPLVTLFRGLLVHQARYLN